jgi:hypothetical protein
MMWDLVFEREWCGSLQNYELLRLNNIPRLDAKEGRRRGLGPRAKSIPSRHCGSWKKNTPRTQRRSKEAHARKMADFANGQGEHAVGSIDSLDGTAQVVLLLNL